MRRWVKSGSDSILNIQTKYSGSLINELLDFVFLPFAISKTNVPLINEQIGAQKKKLKRPRWLAAGFILVRPISDGSFGPAKAAQRSAALKETQKKMRFTCEMSYQCSEELRCPRTVLFSVYGLESLKICASTCASARTTPSLLQLFPVAFKISAPLQKGVALQPVGFYFETHSNITTFTTADIFRNRSMSFCSSANLHVQICFQAATLHNAPQFTALSAIERVSFKHVL